MFQNSPDKEVFEKELDRWKLEHDQIFIELQDNLFRQLTKAEAEITRLKESLEPGKASAIIEGMFKEAQRLGFYKPTGKHALQQFVEEIEK